MVVVKPSLDVPYDSELVDENGQVTRPWVDFFSRVVDGLTDLETAASNMQSLATSTDGHPTATDIANDWESFRADLLKI